MYLPLCLGRMKARSGGGAWLREVLLLAPLLLMQCMPLAWILVLHTLPQQTHLLMHWPPQHPLMSHLLFEQT